MSIKTGKLPVVIILLIVSFFSGLDIVEDYLEGAHFSHIAIELLILVAAIIGLGYLLFDLRKSHIKVVSLRSDLSRTEKDLFRWKSEAEDLIRGLGAAIDRQFAVWNLTPAEKEIGLMMLKGLSFKEIAAIRGTNERTVRQQSVEIYRKSGLSGRSEFSAYFLEDLLLPHAGSM